MDSVDNALLDDSFDAELLQVDAPTDPKVAKLSQERQEDVNVPGPSQAPAAPKEKIEVKANVVNKNHCILVHPKQRGNPLLRSIVNVPWEYDDIVPDYIVGRTSCVLFLSLKYHNLNPDYIHGRIKKLGNMFQLRVLLAQVDLREPHGALKNITRVCLLTDLTLMLAWSPEEAGKIIESYKMFENRSSDWIKERPADDPHTKLLTALSSIKHINKTDSMTLLQNFGTLENIMKSSEERLVSCPGLGPRKAKKLYKLFHEPFCN
ncbi:DNA excision repair protein ERCC-1 [Phlebotomus papatasi]|uniref:DNA excision repair protein ERCC-1 n=1 Tax=Phlebotomus papatasi TaxID=29031 RepID=UPI002483C585|nr:DNA excision repair protein ERCC-1 [Phlebotomus papatasi]